MSDMTSTEFKDFLKRDPVAILILGATEAHGIHLPLDCDTVQPEYIADRIDERLDNILIAPPLNYALHSTTKNLPGTISLTFDTLRAVVHDMLMSLHSQGVDKFVVMTGHSGGGHMTAISEGCKEFVSKTDAQVMFFADCDIGEGCPEMRDVMHDGHGGLAETSRMMAIRPGSVKGERPIGRYLSKGSLVLKDASITFPEGMVGDTTKASVELGDAINKFITENAIAMIQNGFK